MAEISLGGYTFTTSDERDALAELRRTFSSLGERHRTNFIQAYGTYRTADDLFQNFPQRVERALSEAADLAAREIAARRIYHVDLVSIKSMIEENVSEIDESYVEIRTSYLDIVGNALQQDTRRQEAMDYRGRVVGGGFGVEGAAKGIATAAAANLAIGLVQGLANLADKAANSIGDSRKKRELLNAEETRAGLADFLQNIAIQAHLVVAKVVNATAPAPLFDCVTKDEGHKAEGLGLRLNHSQNAMAVTSATPDRKLAASLS